jgi:hypothetical protein
MINVTPFAICAMDTDPHKKRTNPASLGPPAAPVTEELVEYGFRRGVGYDLMKLNPYASTAANFLVNPIAPPGTTGSPTDMTDAAVGPFLCAGTMAMPRLSGGTITVASQFNLRLPTLFDRFNSRFDDFTSGNCDPWAAPPDINIWRYNAALGTSIPWMSPAGPQQVAQSTSAGITPLRTLADLDAPATTASGQFGVLWSFARAVPYSSYTPGQAEPTAGYTTFNKTDWASLYDPFRPTSTGTSHPAGVSTTPYSITATNAVPSLAHRPGIRNRRVLNVPLLSCPVTGTSASVVALGKFFMTMPATANNIYAEFAGVALESSLATKVELHP